MNFDELSRSTVYILYVINMLYNRSVPSTYAIIFLCHLEVALDPKLSQLNSRPRHGPPLLSL